ncbi:MAG: hypothetical protein RHS_4479 [Robinsoniella sp. RHS]|nr:MAG: hypothetical protein RHS_4479 [Robinsoniella sp. RHS]
MFGLILTTINSNIGCIETILIVIPFCIPLTINSNIGCIET